MPPTSVPPGASSPVWADRAYGVGFLLVVASLIGLSIASFQKVFTDVVTVTLETDRIGNQLQESSDVKLRGLIVGEVREIETTGSGARLQLALQPEMVGQIPADVSRPAAAQDPVR